MFHEVVFKFIPYGQDDQFPKMYSADEIGHEAYLDQITNDRRPYAEMPHDIFRMARNQLPVGATNTDIARFLMDCEDVRYTIRKPVDTDFYEFYWA